MLAPEQKGHPELAQKADRALESIIPPHSTSNPSVNKNPEIVTLEIRSAEKTTGNFQADISPLDQIRQKEAEGLRKVIIARQASERKIYEARGEAARIKKLARESAAQQARELYKETAAAAQQEAQELRSQAKTHADELTARAKLVIEQGVAEAVNIVLGLKEETPK